MGGFCNFKGSAPKLTVLFSTCFPDLKIKKCRYPPVFCAGHDGCVTIGSAMMADRSHVAQPNRRICLCVLSILAPLYRSTVGFDRLFSLLDNVAGYDNAAPGYPPYNIERTGDNTYRISVAVAGFAEPEISIVAKENTLTIKGEKQTKTDENKGEVLYQGIAARTFERTFQLAEHVEVKGASLENGLCPDVDLVREVPEAKKPRQIAINGNSKPKVVEAKAA